MGLNISVGFVFLKEREICRQKLREKRQYEETQDAHLRATESALKQTCPHSLQKEATLLPPRFWTSSLQRCERICC